MKNEWHAFKGNLLVALSLLTLIVFFQNCSLAPNIPSALTQQRVMEPEFTR